MQESLFFCWPMRNNFSLKSVLCNNSFPILTTPVRGVCAGAAPFADVKDFAIRLADMQVRVEARHAESTSRACVMCLMRSSNPITPPFIFFVIPV